MYLTTRELNERGWTKSLIKKFLPEPDKEKNNFPYGVTFLYGIYRVQKKEDLPEFKELQAKALARREKGKEIAERRGLENLAKVESLPITVEYLDRETVLKQAIRSFNNWQWTKAERYQNWDELSEADENSEPQFLERITVNYIRHHLTRYDNLLASQYGKIGKFDAVEIIQKRVFAEIKKQYPYLADEVERQMKSRGIENT